MIGRHAVLAIAIAIASAGCATAGDDSPPVDDGVGAGAPAAAPPSATGIAGASSITPSMCPWTFTPDGDEARCEHEGEQCDLPGHADCFGPPCDVTECKVTVREGVESTYGITSKSVCKNGVWQTVSSGHCATADEFICDCPEPVDTAPLPDAAALKTVVFSGPSAVCTVGRDELSVGEGNVELYSPGIGLVTDGMGASVTCSVKQLDAGFEVAAEIDAQTVALYLADHTVPSSAQQFSLRATYSSLMADQTTIARIASTDSLSQSSASDSRCMLTVKSIAPGQLWASFSCENMVDPNLPGDACVMTGHVALENCER